MYSNLVSDCNECLLCRDARCRQTLNYTVHDRMDSGLMIPNNSPGSDDVKNSQPTALTDIITAILPYIKTLRDILLNPIKVKIRVRCACSFNCEFYELRRERGNAYVYKNIEISVFMFFIWATGCCIFDSESKLNFSIMSEYLNLKFENVSLKLFCTCLNSLKGHWVTNWYLISDQDIILLI